MACSDVAIRFEEHTRFRNGFAHGEKVERPEPGFSVGPGWLAALRTCGGGPGRLVSFQLSRAELGIASGRIDADRW